MPVEAHAMSSTMRPAAGRLERLSVVLVMAAYSAALTPVIRMAAGNGALNPGESDPGSFAVQAFALVVTLAWAVRTTSRAPGRAAAYARAAIPYLLIVGLCLLSAAWSAYPGITLRRATALGACVGYGLYLHDRLGWAAMLRLYVRTVLGLTVLSAAVYLVLPGIGRDPGLGYDTAMRGVFATKNAAGEALLLAVAAVLALGAAPGAHRRRAAWALTALMAGLVLTRSATSLGVAAVVAAVGIRPWLRTPGARLLHAAALCGAVLCAAFAVLAVPDALWGLLGRDASLTGRVPLWEEAWAMIAKRPLFGYGYAAFWNADSPDVRYLWRVIGWNAPNAHNGYVDVLLQLGFAGLALYAVLWGRLVVRAFRRPGLAGRAVLLLMAVNVLLNLGEGPMPYADEFTLFAAAALAELARRPAASRTTAEEAPPRALAA